MTITRLKLSLEQSEYLALLKVAEEELRNPTDQARYILRQELERRGLLHVDPFAKNLLTGDFLQEKVKSNAAS